MDITQLVSTAVSVVGIALVGVLAVIPPVLEAAAGRDGHRPARPRIAGHHPAGHHPADHHPADHHPADHHPADRDPARQRPARHRPTRPAPALRASRRRRHRPVDLAA